MPKDTAYRFSLLVAFQISLCMFLYNALCCIVSMLQNGDQVIVLKTMV